MLSRRTHEMPLLTCSRFKVVNIFQSSECATSSLATSSADFKFLSVIFIAFIQYNIFVIYFKKRQSSTHIYICIPGKFVMCSQQGEGKKKYETCA